jgi:hypothetical protein
MTKRFTIYFTLTLFSCLDPYPARDSDVPRNVLVVEGFIDVNSRRATVKLSRLANLTDNTSDMSQSANSIHIEDENGKRYILTAISNGHYSVDMSDVDYDKKYKLIIHVSGDERYESDLIDVIKTPPIESLEWEGGDDGVRIYASTISSTDQTPYFQWDFTETWVYTAPLESTLKVIAGIPYPRTSLDNVFVCWKTLPATKTNIFATTSLSSNVVSRRQIQLIPKGSQKTSIHYSIEVKQRAITAGEHEYLKLLQQTTENLGGLFDPLPSQTVSNVKPLGSNPSPVGYFSGSSTDTKRMFISFYDLPDILMVPQRHNCVPDTICFSRVQRPDCRNDFASMSPRDLLIVEKDGWYLKTNYSCADCRAQGGTLEKPDFWP